jgi:hypothetical protein
MLEVRTEHIQMLSMQGAEECVDVGSTY